MSVWFGLLLWLAPVAVSAAVPVGLSELTDLNGRRASLSSERFQLIVFWATWCEDCRTKLRKELPELDRRPDVSVITVNTDRDISRVQEFIAKEGITLPVFRDPEKKLRRALKIYSVPHWAIYRKEGAGDRISLVASEPAFDLERVLKELRDL